jgi:hypothetical protein
MAWEYLKFFHIAVAFAMAGGIAISLYAIFQARQTAEPATFEIYSRMNGLGGMITAGGFVVASVLGVLTAWQMHIPLTSTGWLNAAYATVAIMAFVSSLTFARWQKRTDSLTAEAREKGAVLPEQKRLIAGSRTGITWLFMMIMLVWLLYVMVFKPF